MSNRIHTNLLDVQSIKHNKDYKRLKDLHDKVEDAIFKLEVELSGLYQEKHQLGKKLKILEEEIVAKVITP